MKILPDDKPRHLVGAAPLGSPRCFTCTAQYVPDVIGQVHCLKCLGEKVQRTKQVRR